MARPRGRVSSGRDAAAAARPAARSRAQAAAHRRACGSARAALALGDGCRSGRARQRHARAPAARRVRSRAGRRVLRAGSRSRVALHRQAPLQVAAARRLGPAAGPPGRNGNRRRQNLRRYTARVHGGARGLSGSRRHRKRLSRRAGRYRDGAALPLPWPERRRRRAGNAEGCAARGLRAIGDDDLVLRGLHFGIVDEADSVFIDEARTPLILSASTQAAGGQGQCAQALAFAGELVAGEDYTVDFAERSVTLAQPGKAKLAERAMDLQGIWASARAREELVTQALSARILFRRDQHYVVSEGKVQIVDESTGRVMPDRSWEHGLHQMIEAKEGCAATERRETLARLTYQRLFRRYLRLAGMTGTAKEVAREIAAVYRLDVVRVPLHRPSRRSYGAARNCATLAEKWNAVADSVERMALFARRPVLIGTRSVKASEQLSAVLARRGIEHALLNAKQDKAEAEVIALAGH